MHNGKSFLAIIPARGGSKRLPRKNILDLSGKPLILWTIEAALKSSYIDDIIVSSDDDEILSISEQNGIDLIKRPDDLASDTTTTFDVVKHVMDNRKKYNYIVLLQPTSPLRNETHIDAAIVLLAQKKADAIISVCKMEHSPLWSNKLPTNGSMSGFLQKEILNKRSQDLDQYYRLNGAIYICDWNALKKERSFFIKEKIYSYIMETKYSIDIDDDDDFKLAQLTLPAMESERESW